uniref:Large ribosomal subunit protein eL14 n=1 Tax=Parascaris univalens TaxID=6257 RepID=A0A915C6W0_PARUN
IVVIELQVPGAKCGWRHNSVPQAPGFDLSSKRVLQAKEMVYKRMVEIGRVVFIARGDNSGKLAAIVDVVDGNRALIDGPSSGVCRSVRNFKDLQLTKFTIPLRHGMRTKMSRNPMMSPKINEKWAGTLWA